MRRKKYGTHGSDLLANVICHVTFILCAFSFNINAESLTAQRVKDAEATFTYHDRVLWQNDNASRVRAPVNGLEKSLPENRTGAYSGVLTGASAVSSSDTWLKIMFFDLFSRLSGAGAQQEWPFASGAIHSGERLLANKLAEPLTHFGATRGGASVISHMTPDLVSRIFPGAPRANIERYWPLLRKALSERGLVDRAMVLMALATVRAETAMFDPISEAPSALNTMYPGPAFNKYDRRQDLGNQGPPDGAMFRGRGFIQLTGRKNYRIYGAMLGYNLTSNPELANSPQPAAQILAAYLKENEIQIRSALAMGDLAAARRIINGGGNGLDIFREAFLLGNQLIRDYGRNPASSTETWGRGERREGATASAPSKRNVVKLRGGRNDARKTRVNPKNSDNETNGEERGKKSSFPLLGFFRMFRHLASPFDNDDDVDQKDLKAKKATKTTKAPKALRKAKSQKAPKALKNPKARKARKVRR